MTTHEQHTYQPSADGFENPTDRIDPAAQPEPAPEHVSEPTREPAPDHSSEYVSEPVREPSPEHLSEPVREPSTEHVADATTERELFADNELAGLRARWDNVQATFVDDPRDCVQKADGLVSDVVVQLTQGFSDARARLEAQWARGEEASTEDLRVALKQYREFFQRLLAV